MQKEIAYAKTQPTEVKYQNTPTTPDGFMIGLGFVDQLCDRVVWEDEKLFHTILSEALGNEFGFTKKVSEEIVAFCIRTVTRGNKIDDPKDAKYIVETVYELGKVENGFGVK